MRELEIVKSSGIYIYLGVDHLEEGDIEASLLQLALYLDLLFGGRGSSDKGVDESEAGQLE